MGGGEGGGEGHHCLHGGDHVFPVREPVRGRVGRVRSEGGRVRSEGGEGEE